MNPEYPPIPLRQPKIANLRPPPARFAPPTPIDVELRTAKARDLREQVARINSHMRTLSPEQKRAVFLKLRHDRPLRLEDLAGTGLKPMSSLQGTETLVIPRREDLDQLDQRLGRVEENRDPSAKPPGQDLGMALTAIEEGNPRDRLSAALAGKFDELVRRDFIIYELEIASFMPRENSRRTEIVQIMEELRGFLGLADGRVYEVDYAGDGARVLLSSTGDKFRQLVELPQWQRKIIFFDERPSFQTFSHVFETFNIQNIRILPPPADAETICVIDSGIAAGNPLLEPVLNRPLCRSYVPGCEATVDEVNHGSGVASLAAYFNIDPSPGATNQARARVASARILDEQGYLDKFETDDEGKTRVAHARLLSSLLRQIVQDYHRDGVRIFVLTFNIIGHYWSQANRGVVSRNAWVARTIDQLSREFDVIFVTITGNILAAEVEEFQQQSPYPTYFSLPLAKLLDPGQAALSVTAGSIAHSARVAVQNAAAIANEGNPSPFTRSGPGFSQAIKPDFVERGGNFVAENGTRAVRLNQTTSVVMANNQLTPALKLDVGTSFAGPRLAFHLAVISHELRQLGVAPTSVLLRAFLAASTECPGQLHAWCEEKLGGLDNALSVVGHGLPSSDRALDCHGSSVLLHFQGNVPVGRVVFFQIPVPTELAEVGRGTKRIVVAVATAPPVQKWGLGEYVGVKTQFRLFRGDVDPASAEAFMAIEDSAATKRPDIDDMDGQIGLTRRSVGTLQRESFDWSQHGRDYSAHPYLLAVALKPASWLQDGEQMPIAVIVRIEEETRQCTTLYSLVRAAVLAEVEVQARAGA